MKIDPKTREKLDALISGLRTERYSWWLHWRELGDYILPRRYKWLVTPNQANRGSQINGQIIDSTGTIAARNCASGMLTGTASPTRPWFKLRIEGFNNTDDTNPISMWLLDTEKRMMKVFQESNFYNAVAILLQDLVVFGTAPMLIYENYDDVICCYNPCAGEYFVANDAKLQIGTFAREFVRTAGQLVDQFGIENVSDDIKLAYEMGGANLTREFMIRHVIEPNSNAMAGISSKMPWREVYWNIGSDTAQCLGVKGFWSQPFICPRWDIVANDPYGRSPAMDALPDIKQLQQEQKRKGQAIDKMVNPPMLADIMLKNQPASILPGGVTYIPNLRENSGMKPIFQVNPEIREMMEDIQAVQERIRVVFFNDLFLMISQLNTVRSATEIDARREEKMIMLGPVLERFHNEALDPIIERVFDIMLRGGLLAPPPAEIAGAELDVEYVSTLAEAQKAAASAGIERLFGITGNLAAIQPAVLDVVDFDAGLDEYATLLGVSPRVIRDSESIAQLRQQRAQSQALQQAMPMVNDLAKSAKVASEIDVGGGQNAIQAMTGLQ